MQDFHEEFSRLTAALLDGTASPDETRRFNVVFQQEPACRALYFQQIRVHALMEYNRLVKETGGITAWSQGRKCGGHLRKIAALAACLLIFLSGVILIGTRSLSSLRASPLSTEFRAAPASIAAEPVPFEKKGTVALRAAVVSAPAAGAIPSPRASARSVPEPGEAALEEVKPVTRAAEAAPLNKENQMSTIKQAAAAVAGSAGIIVAAVSRPALAQNAENAAMNVSAEIMAVTDPDAMPFWHTLPSATPVVRWEWPDGASSATLTVSGMSVRVLGPFSPPLNRVTVSLPEPSIPGCTEDVYVFTLAFDTGARLVSSPMGNVTGAGGKATRALVSSDYTNKPWTRLTSSAVLPVGQGEVLVLDSKTVDTGLGGAAGWYCWNPVKTGKHIARQTLGGVQTVRSLVKFPSGTVVMLR